MKKQILLLCGVAVAMLSTSNVYASTIIFNFSFTGNSSVTGDPGVPFSGSGQFTASEVGTTNVYKVTAVTGTTDNATISKVIKPGGFAFNDNLLFYNSGDASATLDNGGVAYQLSNGIDVDLFLSTTGTGAQQLFGFTSSLQSEEQSAPISITPPSTVPEPSTLALLGTGVVGFAGAIRRKIAA